MNKKILNKIFILLFFLIIVISNKVYARDSIQIESNKTEIKKGEETEIIVNITEPSISALTIEIYFDMTKLEYVSENTDRFNFSENRIIYTWVSENGGETYRKDEEIARIKFKAKQQTGIANIVVTGEFYNSNGEEIQIDDGNIQINIAKDNKNDYQQQQLEAGDDNANLKIMRINQEGVSPNFEPEVKEYYFIADGDINKLDITAIPENKDATVNITGNNLKFGSNTVNIEVISKDKTNKSVYKIYVTKTNNKQLATANLENLAVREAEIIPEFDNNVTNYEIELATNIDEVYILAIPESINAEVKIENNKNLKIGNNKITITVTAEDKITKKKYIIQAYRRNENEEKQAEQDKQAQVQQLNSILQNQEQNGEEEEQNQNESFETKDETSATFKNKNTIIYVVTFFIIMIILIYIVNKPKKA